MGICADGMAIIAEEFEWDASAAAVEVLSELINDTATLLSTKTGGGRPPAQSS